MVAYVPTKLLVQQVSSPYLQLLIEDAQSRGLTLEEVDYALEKPAIRQAIVRLIKQYASPPYKPSHEENLLSINQLEQLANYIHEHIEQPISVTDLARQLGYSASRFSKLFSDTTEQSPHKYITSCRIEKAKTYLTETTLSGSDIAFRVGFTDQSHLIKVFKETTRITPNEFRKQK